MTQICHKFIPYFFTKLFTVFFFSTLFLLPDFVIAQSSAPLSRTPGAPAGSYKLADFDTVNLFSGNLNFNLPLLNVGGRGGNLHPLSLVIENQWQMTQQNLVDGTYLQEFLDYAPRSLMVGSVNFEIRYEESEALCNLNTGERGKIAHHAMTYTEPDGTEHVLKDKILHGKPYYYICAFGNYNIGRVFESSDGSFITFVSDADQWLGYQPNQPSTLDGYLYFPNGNKSRIENTKIVWTQDRNGNRTEFSYASSSDSRLSKIKDSIGREIVFQYGVNEPSPYGVSNKIIYKGFGGAEKVIRISIDTLSNALRVSQTGDSSTVKTYHDLFWNGSPSHIVSSENTIYDPIKPKAVWLPDGRSYQFKYNVYGQLARVELPTGGAVEYDFVSALQADNRVKEKRVYNHDGLTEKTVFSSGVIEKFDASGKRLSKSKHYFHGNVAGVGGNYASWKTGKEYKTEFYDADGVTLLNVVDKTWQQRIPSWCYNNPHTSDPCGNNPSETAPTSNPFVLETKSTLAGTNLVSKTSAVNPVDGSWAFDAFNNQTDIWEYDYGVNQPGQFLKRTHIDYMNGSDYTGYTGSYLLNLPQQTWISQDIGGNNVVSKTEFKYDETTLDPRSNVVGWIDPNNPKRGNLTKTRNWLKYAGEPEIWLETKTEFDVLGNPIKLIDAKNNISTIDYIDRFGSPDGEARTNVAPTQLNGQSTFAFPTSGENAKNWIIGYTQFDYFTGQPVNAEDMNGVISKTIYNDPLDRPTQSFTAVGTAYEIQSNITYDDANRRIQTRSDLNTLNDNLIKSESFYDGLGRTTETRKYEADGSFITTKSVPFVMVQDPETSLWRLATQVSNPYRTNETVYWTINLSDSLGRLIKTILPDGSIVKTEYSGNAVTVTDQAGKQRRSITNALGQLVRVDEPTDAGGLGALTAPNQPTYYEYDTLSNLITVKQGGTFSSPEQTRNFVYDSLSRLKSAENPESGLIQYQYDNNGNLTEKKDARLVKTTYAYDALNRVTSRIYADEPTGQLTTPNVTYTYDNLINAKGKLTKVTTTGTNGNTFSAVTDYQQFDSMGRVTQSQQTIDGITYGTSPQIYKYNLSGALLEQTYPSGRVVKNVLDAEGDLALVQSKKNSNYGYWNYAKSFTYTAAGAVSSMQLGNGKWESTQFNSRLQPTQIALGTTQNGTDKLKLNFTYNTTTNNVANADNNGNVLSQTITVPTETRGSATYAGFTATQNYTYDSLNRLKSAEETIPSQTGWKQTFKYDRYGNRNFDYGANPSSPDTTTPNGQTTLPKVVNPEILTTNNRFKQDQDNDSIPDYLYDAAGNTTRDANNKKFTYDGENKQTKVETVNSSGTVTGTLGTYFYDGDGKRVKKVSATETVIFIYDASGKLVAEYANQTATTTAQVSYLTSDHLGSPRINTDQNGIVTSRHDYQPFGEEIYSITGNTARMGYSVDAVRKQFTSYERDNESGLDFAQARYYGGSYGRFTSPDNFLNATRPENPATWNLYAYVLNNPLRYVDPSGEIERDADGNVIFHKTGEDTIYFKKKEKLRDANGKAIKITVMKDGKEKKVTAYASVSWKADVGYVKANDGTKIDASKATTGLNIEITDKKGNVFQEQTDAMQKSYDDAGYNNTTDCHGNTFASGQVWINNDQVENLMTGDGYRQLGKKETTQSGDVGIYSKDGTLSPTSVQHSVTVNDAGATSVTSKGGITPLQPNIAPGPGPGTAWKPENVKLTYWTQRTKSKN